MAVIHKIDLSADSGLQALPSVDPRFRAMFGNRGEVIPGTVTVEKSGDAIVFQYSVPEGQGERVFICRQTRDGSTTVFGSDRKGKPWVAVANPSRDGGVTVIADGEQSEFDAAGRAKAKRARRCTRRFVRYMPRLKKIKAPKFKMPKFRSDAVAKLKLKKPDENSPVIVKAGLGTVGAAPQPLSGNVPVVQITTGGRMVFFSPSDVVAGATTGRSQIKAHEVKGRPVGTDGSGSGSTGLMQKASLVVFLRGATPTDARGRALRGGRYVLRPFTSEGAALMVLSNSSGTPVMVMSRRMAKRLFGNRRHVDVEVVKRPMRQRSSTGVHVRHRLQFRQGLVFAVVKGDKRMRGDEDPIQAARRAADKVVMAQQGVVLAMISKIKSESRYAVNAPSHSEQSDHQRDHKGGNNHGRDDNQPEEQYAT